MPDAYYRWLVGLIGDGYIEVNYQKLLWKLFTTEFIYELDFDENRAADGLFLRKIYTRETGDHAKNGPCSMLEMMVALARDAEDDIMHDPDFGDRTGQWFLMMMENLGLDIYDDYYYFEGRVNIILDTFMHHKYAPNGSSGGMFPVQNCARDMRKTDLWWQLNNYFEENFPVQVW